MLLSPFVCFSSASPHSPHYSYISPPSSLLRPNHYCLCRTLLLLLLLFLSSLQREKPSRTRSMESSKIYAFLFICMLFISSATPILGCGYCGKPPKKHKPGRKPKTPIAKPIPPVTVPPVTVPPVTVPPIVKPPITLPPIVKPPVTLPPVTVPPVLNPPTPSNGGKPCQPPKSPAQATCPIDTLKLGACVDLLGGLVHIGIGDPVVNQCCPVLQGLVELEAAVCLCTTLKLKLLNLNIYVPLALQLLVTCGKTPPPGYTCSL